MPDHVPSHRDMVVSGFLPLRQSHVLWDKVRQ